MVSYGIVSVILVCVLPPWSQGEVFTATSDIEPLLSTHKLVVNHIDDLVKREEKKLGILKKKLKTYKREHWKAMEDVPNYLGNPINAFTLIKRLTKDLYDIDEIVHKEFENYYSFNRQNVSLPSEEDLVGAAHALTRLQATYKLQVKDLAKGLLNGVPYSSAMSADDCFEIGRALYGDEDYWNSIDWMKEALRKFKQGDKNFVFSFTEVDVYEHVSWAYYKVLDFDSALKWNRKLLELAPNNDKAKANEKLFSKPIAEMPVPEGDDGEEEKNDYPYFVNDLRYDALCRGDYDVPQEITKKLFCFYLTENHPFLRLAPIKSEQKYANPDVFVYYDVIYDDEIAHVQEKARPKHQRATVIDKETGKPKPAEYRISKTAWLKDEESEIVRRISQRIQDFTGLIIDPHTAEQLQIANYGIGGHYLPHYDQTRKGEAGFKGWPTNRIATVLFYLSEVAEGGATVFTELGLSVFPIKNAALVWRNLHPSGEADLYSRHAACPVLRGSKWVANKWIHQGGQELVKNARCTLEYQEEEWNRDIPEPILKVTRK